MNEKLKPCHCGFSGSIEVEKLVFYEAECERLRAELATVKKVAYGNLELLNEIEQLRAESAALKAQD